MGLGVIPYSAIDRYAARHGYDEPDEFALLLAVVRACDSAYLAEKRRQEASVGGA